jgi:hypothetical protein
VLGAEAYRGFSVTEFALRGRQGSIPGGHECSNGVQLEFPRPQFHLPNESQSRVKERVPKAWKLPFRSGYMSL